MSYLKLNISHNSSSSDDFAPELNCPDDTTVFENPVSWRRVLVEDNIDEAPTLVCSHQRVTHFTLGETTVMCTATDNLGNSDSCAFTVNLQGEAGYKN